MNVKFENMRFGSIDFTLSNNGNEILTDSISYTPYDSFGDLILALDSFREEYQTCDECKVILNTEPYEYELKFSGTNHCINLSIESYSSHERNAAGEKIYTVMGNYSEICIPFWRALRSLQGLYSDKDFKEMWYKEFPSKELDTLTSKINT